MIRTVHDGKAPARIPGTPNLKMPWHMTRAEWQREIEKAQINFSGCGGNGRTGFTTAADAVGMINRIRFLRCNLPDANVHGLQIAAGYDRVISWAKKTGRLRKTTKGPLHHA